MTKSFLHELLSFIAGQDVVNDSQIRDAFGENASAALDAIADLKAEGLVHALIRPNRMSPAPRVLAVANVRLTVAGLNQLSSM